ncbi:MAG: Multidrug resistance protein MdtA precursor [Pseudomonadota bacterium]
MSHYDLCQSRPAVQKEAHSKGYFLFAASAVAAALLLSACSPKKETPEPVRSVKLITVGASDLNVQGEYAAEVKARIESRLGFRVGGKMIQRQAEAGQRVKAGQVLAEIDVQDYALAAQAAQAQVIGARSQRDLAAADFKRYEALLAQNFISAAELERRSATLKAAQATLDQALAQAQSQSNQASYAKLMATTSGVVTSVEAEPGQVVSAGQPVVRFAHDGPRDAVFAVPEHVVGRLKLGQKMTATLGNGQQTLQGQVREVGASADPVTRTFTVKLGLEKAEALPLGVTLNVHAPQLAGSQANVIKVPTSALRQEGQQTAVWVFDVASSTVISQAVQVATADGNEVVIASGLKPGQQIVSAGVHVLSPGQKVTVYKPEAIAPAVGK